MFDDGTILSDLPPPPLDVIPSFIHYYLNSSHNVLVMCWKLKVSKALSARGRQTVVSESAALYDRTSSTFYILVECGQSDCGFSRLETYLRTLRRESLVLFTVGY
jgi:hypothetical protein